MTERKTKMVGFMATPTTFALLRLMAQADGRSVSGMVRKLVDDALKAGGFVKEEESDG